MAKIYEVHTREIVDRIYDVKADSPEAAREALKRGEFERHIDVDVQIDEIISITPERI